MAQQVSSELFQSLEIMEQKVQSAIKTFVIKVRDESFALDSKSQGHLDGQTLIEKANMVLTRMLFKLEDPDILKIQKSSQETDSSKGTTSSYGVTLSELLECLSAFETKMTASQQKQSDLEERQMRLEKSSGQVLEGNVSRLRREMRELAERCHELENNQEAFCLKQELEAVKKDCLSKQSEVEKKCTENSYFVSAISKEMTSIRQDTYSTRNSTHIQANEKNEIISQIATISSHLNSLDQRVSEEEVVRAKMKEFEFRTMAVEKKTSDIEEWKSEVEKRTVDVKKFADETEHKISEMKKQHKKSVTRTQAKVEDIENKYAQMKYLITTKVNNLEALKTSLNGIRDRAAYGAKLDAVSKEVLDINRKTQAVETKVSDIEKRTSSVEKKASDMDKKITDMDHRIYGLDRKLTTSDSLNSTSVTDINRKLGAVESSLTNISQTVYSTKGPVAFSVQTHDHEVLKKGEPIKNFTDVLCNVRNCFDTQHGMFTVQDDGLYLFGATFIKHKSTNLPLGISVDVVRNSVKNIIAQMYFSEEDYSSSGTAVHQLKKGDIVLLYVYNASNGVKLHQGSVFFGCQIK